MISLILPYWDRQEAADVALDLIAKQYVGLALEVIVVDDGSPRPFVTRHPVRVVRLPAKTEACATCVPLNRGVEASSGEFIALSCVEMLHTVPVLEEMRETLEFSSPDTYVSAAVWAPESGVWHAHSSLKRPPLNFMTMLRRSLWEKTGGFDEEYREGIAFDDNDFVKRLARAGAQFVIRDDLIVQHPRKGAKAKYRPEQHERNRLLFARKWASATS